MISCLISWTIISLSTNLFFRMFRSHALIIHKHKIRDGQTRIVLFSREFGRVTAWSKKNNTPGVGSLHEVQIERIGNLNHIKSFDTSTDISWEWWKYIEVFGFLQIMQTLYQMLPESHEQMSIYDDIRELIENLHTHTDRQQALLLGHVRVLKKLGSLRNTFLDPDILCRYIYTHIDKKSMKSILLWKNIKSIQRSLLSKAIEESRHFALS